MSQTTEALIAALVRRAARTAPSSLSARLEEEWLADLHERASSLSRLRFAVGCYWASVAIGLEHGPFSAPVASTGQGHASMIVEPPRFLSSRAVTFGLVLTLHAAVFCGLMMARTTLFKALPEPPAIEPRVIDRPAPPIKPPQPEFKRFVDQLKPPPLPPPVEPADDASVPKIADNPNPVLPQPSGGEGLSPPQEMIRVQGGPGPAFPRPDDYYPDASRRLEEQGATILRVCVDAAGRLSTEPVASATSGSGRLDAAAIKLAKAGSGHYRPTTEDGRPVPSCYPLKIRFQLRN
jgi:TonB family protein